MCYKLGSLVATHICIRTNLRFRSVVTTLQIRTAAAIFALFFFTMWQCPSGSRPHHYRGFMITIRHTTLGRTPLDERSAQRRGLYLTTNKTHKRDTSMPPAGFEPTIPASERPQTHPFDCAATGIGIFALLNAGIKDYTR